MSDVLPKSNAFDPQQQNEIYYMKQESIIIKWLKYKLINADEMMT